MPRTRARRLLTLNVSNPPKERAERLLHWLWGRDEDVWVLTEVGRGEGSSLMVRVCRAAGYAAVETDRSDLGVVVVSRTEPLRHDAIAPSPVLPGRVGSFVVGEDDPLRLLAVYGAASDPVRYSSRARRARKREWLAAFDGLVEEWVARPGPGALVGDLNVVDPEHEDELRYVLVEEVETYRALGTRHGLRDAYRQVHATDSPSWVDHSGAGCRYDHAFVTRGVDVEAADLDDGPRVDGLTDHSALTVTVRRSRLRG